MDPHERAALAQDRADSYARHPTGGSWMAGVCTAVVALVGDVALSGFYGWEVRDNILIAGLVSAAGFVGGVVGYKNLKRLNRRAVRTERDQIDDEQDAGSTH